MQTPTAPAFHISHHRALSDPAHKPLDAERSRFISMVSALLVVQLCASIALVVSVAVTVDEEGPSSLQGRGGGGGGGGGGGWGAACGEDCRLWCAVDCRSIGRNSSSSTEAGNVTVVAGCCVERKEILSTIYEKSVQQKFLTRDINEKRFDGIRVREIWTEDSLNSWSKSDHPSIVYFKDNRTFRILSSGTYFVHSRIDFNCSSANSRYNQTIAVRNESHPNSFEDIRINLSSKDTSTIYTSSIDVMVELTKGEQLVMLTVPHNCNSPRSIVVYRLQDL